MRSAPIRLNAAERKILETWTKSPRPDDRRALRSRIILALAAGNRSSEVAKLLGIRAATVSKWHSRFGRSGLRGLSDAPRSGKPPSYDDSTDDRVLYLLVQPPPRGHPRWNGRLMARMLGDVSKDQVWRILRKKGIRLKPETAGFERQAVRF
ncbi:MAG: helix-turn-helix domain-containing protein [bacterium]